MPYRSFYSLFAHSTCVEEECWSVEITHVTTPVCGLTWGLLYRVACSCTSSLSLPSRILRGEYSPACCTEYDTDCSQTLSRYIHTHIYIQSSFQDTEGRCLAFIVGYVANDAALNPVPARVQLADTLEEDPCNLNVTRGSAMIAPISLLMMVLLVFGSEDKPSVLRALRLVNVLRALRLIGEFALELLPELQELILFRSRDTNDTFTSFIDSRQNAGRPVTLVRYNPSLSCSESSFKLQV